MLAIAHAGLQIPHDIAVVGFDDIPLAEYFNPPLTTIRLPAFRLGQAAGDRLIRLIRGEKLNRTHILMESELIVRASTQKN
jgi:DNA-binding LacI/PurR family transcriptional regulator